MRPTPRLAIIIPTYRWDALARDTLTQAAAIGSDDISVHIGDNSLDPDKHAFLNTLAARSTNVFVTCHATNLGADGNWFYLYRSQQAPYYCMAADDDSFGSAYFRAGLATIDSDPACGTASGLHVSIARLPSQEAPALYSPEERREAEPLDRIRNYRGENSICYAISRRADIDDFVRYTETNPLGCPFNDYMMAFHLLSIGTYRMDRMGYVYLYDNSHWQVNDTFIQSNSRWYKGYALPETFAYMTRLHWAVVAVHFFSSKFRSSHLTGERADAIVAYLFDRQRKEFTDDYLRYRSTIDGLLSAHPVAAAACKRLMTHEYEHIAILFDDFASVVGAFSADVAGRYRAFQAETLRPNADRIIVSWPEPRTHLERAKRKAQGIFGGNQRRGSAAIR